MQIESDVQSPRQFLHTIQQRITLPNCLSEQFLLPVGSVTLDDSLNLVNFAADLAVVDKIAQLSVQKLLSHTECSRHVIDRHRLETFKVLAIRNQSHLFGVVAGMILQVDVLAQRL